MSGGIIDLLSPICSVTLVFSDKKVALLYKWSYQEEEYCGLHIETLVLRVARVYNLSA